MAACIEVAKQVLGGLPHAAILLDTNLGALAVNPGYHRLSGQRRRVVEQRLAQGQWRELLGAADDRRRAEECLATQQAQTFGDVEVENALGDVYVTLQTFMPILDEAGASAALLIIYRDVSDEARIHDRYRELIARERLRADELERQVAARTEQLTRALEEVTRLSRMDPLTGLLNRRAFTDHASQALLQAIRHGRTMAALMLDLDHFKALNDTYGHQAGDAVLEAVAKVLTSAVRSSDIVGRFGGEEFIALLTETTLDGAIVVAERCRSAVRGLPVGQLANGKTDPQTVSIGLARFPGDATVLEDLIRRADMALYRSKQEGRDCVTVYDATLSSSDLPARKPRVLVVVADPTRLDRYVGILGDAGYDAVGASGGAKGLSLCAQEPFDLLIADEELGAETGLDFLHRSIAFLPMAARLLLLTSSEAYLAVRGAHGSQVDHYLLVGEADLHLAGAVESVLVRRALGQEQRPSEMEMTRVPNRVRQALDEVVAQRALRVAYQPIVDAHTGERIGAEALCRVRHPEFPGPAQLFDAAASAGRMWSLARIVREVIARDLERIAPSESIFVNLHAAELSDRQLLEGDPSLGSLAHRIVFEIRERSAIPDASRFLRSAEQLRAQGYRLSVDDLGAGYASLTTAALMRPSFVKIGRTLIHEAHLSRRRTKMLAGIVESVHLQGALAIAEGIESEEEADLARAVGFDALQGFFVGRPTFPTDEDR